MIQVHSSLHFLQQKRWRRLSLITVIASLWSNTFLQYSQIFIVLRDSSYVTLIYCLQMMQARCQEEDTHIKPDSGGWWGFKRGSYEAGCCHRNLYSTGYAHRTMVWHERSCDWNKSSSGNSEVGQKSAPSTLITLTRVCAVSRWGERKGFWVMWGRHSSHQYPSRANGMPEIGRKENPIDPSPSSHVSL